MYTSNETNYLNFYTEAASSFHQNFNICDTEHQMVKIGMNQVVHVLCHDTSNVAVCQIRQRGRTSHLSADFARALAIDLIGA